MSVDLERAPLNEEEYGSTEDRIAFTSWSVSDIILGKIYLCAKVMFIIASIHSLSVLLSSYNTSQDKTFLIDGNGESCEDYRFGCCEIYDTCKVVNTTYYSTDLLVDPMVIHKHDGLGSNCPRLVDIVEDYRYKHGSYDNDNDNDCEIDLTCDYRSYFGKKLQQSNRYIASAYLWNINQGGIMGDTGVSLNDNYNICPQTYNTIRSYEEMHRGYTKAECYLMSFVFFSMIVFVCFICYVITDQ